MPSARRSRFARLFGGEAGIDPYTRAVSDVYQDVFGEGSFIGKGIYDVDAFAAALGGRLPENRVLSHDLLEGAYARVGPVSDVCCSRTSRRATRPMSAAAIAGSAATGRSRAWLCRACRGRGRAVREPDLGAVAVEDPRQPAPQPRADRAAGAARAGAGCAGAALARDARGRSRSSRCPTLRRVAALASRAVPTAARRSTARRRRRRSRGSSLREAFALACLPLRRASQRSTRSRARSWRVAGRPAARLLEWRTAGDAERARPRAAWPASSAMWPALALGAGDRRLAWSRCAGRAGAGARRSLLLWLLAPALVVVAEPAARRARAARCGATTAPSCAPSRAAPGASSRRSSAPRTTSCRPTTSRRIRRAASRTARRRPTSACALLANLAAYDFGYADRRRGDRADRARRWPRSTGAALPRPLLQLVRHARRSSRCGRSTSRPSTAATSPGHCSRSPRASRSSRPSRPDRPLADLRPASPSTLAACSRTSPRSPRRDARARAPARARLHTLSAGACRRSR